MIFKNIFFIITSTAISMAVIGCGGNNSGAGDNRQGPKQATKAITPTLNSHLPKNAKPLHSLPANIIGFVKKNYPGYSIVIVVSDPLCGGGDAIDVAIIKAGSPNLSLIFKPDGTFLQQEQEVPFSTTPVKIKEILKFKYADYTAGGQIETLTLPGATEEYLVGLSRGAKSIEVIFDANGIVICEN